MASLRDHSQHREESLPILRNRRFQIKVTTGGEPLVLSRSVTPAGSELPKRAKDGQQSGTERGGYKDELHVQVNPCLLITQPLEPSEDELFADRGICDSLLSVFKNFVVHLPVFARPLVGHIGVFTSQKV